LSYRFYVLGIIRNNCGWQKASSSQSYVVAWFSRCSEFKMSQQVVRNVKLWILGRRQGLLNNSNRRQRCVACAIVVLRCLFFQCISQLAYLLLFLFASRLIVPSQRQGFHLAWAVLTFAFVCFATCSSYQHNAVGYVVYCCCVFWLPRWVL